jgi:transcriptional regulator with XRE-family HTH domain
MDASPVRTSGFGALLRTRRLDRGLTQEDLAERAGISVRAVGDLERGRTFPRRHTVGRLCEALQLDEETRQQLITLARTDWAARQRPGASPVKPAVLMTPEGPLGLPLAVPAQLPWDVPGFVGRDPEIGRLLADPAGIWVIDGLAGIGKTALAVHVGHLLASRFPDGQLCLDLRGFDLRQPPVPPSAAIGYFLHALGMDQRLPAIADKLTAMFRTAMAGRRMLVILDNAASTEQVSALLPGASECLVLVTSRHRLSGLAARHGARRITLHSLDSGHAVALLTGIAGPELTRHDQARPPNLPPVRRPAACAAYRRRAGQGRGHPGDEPDCRPGGRA